uniref:Neuritin-like protein n=1 Tax=Nannospalax galili TaxID=1026970 RepID=A0A8C6RQ40_NANGA
MMRCCHCPWCCRCQQLPCALRLLLLLPLGLAVASGGPNRCDTIYQGFAKCLISLGDGMGLGGELETAVSQVLSGCPKEAASVWKSLQQEACHAPHPDNLHALCGAPVSVRERGAGQGTNQDTLRATAPALTPASAPVLLAAALTIACILGPLA